MDSLANLFANRKPAKKPPKYQWQELALEVIKTIPDSYTVRASSIFKVCKANEQGARNALNDCKELEKCYIKYFLKVCSEINKKVCDQ